jgi:hypothetical protein
VQSEPCYFVQPHAGKIARLRGDIHPGASVVTKPGERRGDELPSDTATPIRLSHTDETETSFSFAAEMDCDVTRRVTAPTGYQYFIRETIAASFDPCPVQLVALLYGKPSVEIEAAVAVRFTRDRAEQRNIHGCRGTDSGRLFLKGAVIQRMLQLEADINQLEVMLSRQTNGLTIAGEGEKVQTIDRMEV